MNITKAQARQAFYQAAENIEQRPGLLHLGVIEVRSGGEPTCLWGHVGRAVGASSELGTVWDVPQIFGFSSQDPLFEFMCDNEDSGKNLTFPDTLRVFADKHFPAEEHEPAPMSFGELMESLTEAA